eukprot:1121431-Prymnesium_polylepis.1
MVAHTYSERLAAVHAGAVAHAEALSHSFQEALPMMTALAAAERESDGLELAKRRRAVDAHINWYIERLPQIEGSACRSTSSCICLLYTSDAADDM